MRELLSVSLIAAIVAGPIASPAANAQDVHTSTPIKHLVVIFQENASFDHYFATYPNAANPKGEPAFHALPGTPSVNGENGPAVNDFNLNLNPANGKGASNPFRLDRSQAATQDQNHGYTAEQMAFDAGLLDLFPLSTGTAGPPPAGFTTTAEVMGWFDGNTVTAMWNYAQHFAMSDNSWNTTFGPSTPGALNLISGQTNGVATAINATGSVVDGGAGSLTLIDDIDPFGDVCSSNSQVQMGGTNVGDLLNKRGLTWGWFEGGFNLSVVDSNGTTGCDRKTTSAVTGATHTDYVPHHQPFQYYASTANPTHIRPASVATIGHQGDAANHQYDLEDFFSAVSAGNFPAVSFLKASGFQDGHPGYSDPLDEQAFLVRVTNFLQGQPEWTDTAVIIAWDDSDGWYDHQMSPIVNTSTGPADALTGPNACGTAATSLPGIDAGNTHALGRCGFGPRLPFVVISPWSKHNFVDHSVTDQSSITRFIEDNWLAGERIEQGSFDGVTNSILQMFDFKQVVSNDLLILNPKTGEPVFTSSPFN